MTELGQPFLAASLPNNIGSVFFKAHFTALSRSVAWVKKWLKRFTTSSGFADDPALLLSCSRSPKTPLPPPNPLVVERLLDIRDHPPDQLGRTPGPRAIAYFLKKAPVLKERGLKPPSSTSTMKLHHFHGVYKAENKIY